MTAEGPLLDPREVANYLPHRYPFLLVDRVEEMTADERIVATKNVTWNEPYFTGHFPGDPVMKGKPFLKESRFPVFLQNYW